MQWAAQTITLILELQSEVPKFQEAAMPPLTIMTCVWLIHRIAAPVSVKFSCSSSVFQYANQMDDARVATLTRVTAGVACVLMLTLRWCTFLIATLADGTMFQTHAILCCLAQPASMRNTHAVDTL